MAKINSKSFDSLDITSMATTATGVAIGIGIAKGAERGARWVVAKVKTSLAKAKEAEKAP